MKLSLTFKHVTSAIPCQCTSTRPALLRPTLSVMIAALCTETTEPVIPVENAPVAFFTWLSMEETTSQFAMVCTTRRCVTYIACNTCSLASEYLKTPCSNIDTVRLSNSFDQMLCLTIKECDSCVSLARNDLVGDKCGSCLATKFHTEQGYGPSILSCSGMN